MQRLLLGFLLLVGCGGSSPKTREPDEYTGCASDEHWRTFDDQEGAHQVMVSDAMAPTFMSPTSGATLPSATKTTFSWTQDAADPGMAAGDVPYMNGPGCNMCCPQFNTGALATLHLPAISGNLYDLQFSIGGSVSHRVITTLQEWGPPDTVWAAWRDKMVSLSIVRMTVLKNDVRQGPYAPSMPLTFAVGN